MNETIIMLLSAIFGAFVTYLFAIRITRKQHENSVRLQKLSDERVAACNLRATFAPQLSAIRCKSKSAADIQRILESTIDLVTIELEKFRFYVRPESLTAYDKACQEYQDIARIREMNYETFGSKYPFKVFENKIKSIFHFTNLL